MIIRKAVEDYNVNNTIALTIPTSQACIIKVIGTLPTYEFIKVDILRENESFNDSSEITSGNKSNRFIDYSAFLDGPGNWKVKIIFTPNPAYHVTYPYRYFPIQILTDS